MALGKQIIKSWELIRISDIIIAPNKITIIHNYISDSFALCELHCHARRKWVFESRFRPAKNVNRGKMMGWLALHVQWQEVHANWCTLCVEGFFLHCSNLLHLWPSYRWSLEGSNTLNRRNVWMLGRSQSESIKALELFNNKRRKACHKVG